MKQPDELSMIQSAVAHHASEVRALLKIMMPPQLNDDSTPRLGTPRCIPLAIGVVLATRYADDPVALEVAELLFLAALSYSPGKDAPGHQKLRQVWDRLSPMLLDEINGGSHGQR